MLLSKKKLTRASMCMCACVRVCVCACVCVCVCGVQGGMVGAGLSQVELRVLYTFEHELPLAREQVLLYIYLYIDIGIDRGHIDVRGHINVRGCIHALDV
jgi:hypothetical protein